MALLWQKGKKGADIKADKPEKTPAKAPKAPKAEKVSKEVAVKKAEGKNDKRAAAAAGVSFAKGSAVIGPRVTEKAGILSEQGVYTFNVQTDAKSAAIAKAVEEAYKVTVTDVRVATVKGKTVFARGKRGRTVGGKKAYVSLKEGDKIEFI